MDSTAELNALIGSVGAWACNSTGLPPSASLVLASALWGVATVISKELLASVPPVTLLVLQLTPSVLALWFFVIATGPHQPSHGGGLLPVALIGVLSRKRHEPDRDRFPQQELDD